MDPQLFIQLVQTGGLVPIIGYFLLKILPDMNREMASSIKDAGKTTAASMDRLSDKHNELAKELSLLREHVPTVCQYGRISLRPNEE